MQCNTRGSCGRSWTFGVVLLLGLGLVAWSVFAGRRGESSVAAPDDRPTVKEFEAKDLSGKVWKLADHKGKVVMINVWATWCPPCRAETPGLVKTYGKYASKGFDAVGVSVDQGNTDKVREFAEAQKIPYPIVMGQGLPITADVDAIPVTILVDQKGREAQRFVGAVSEEKLSQAIERVLAEK